MAKREKIDNFIDPPQEFIPSEVSLQGQGRRSAGRGMVTLTGTAARVALQKELPRDHPTSHSTQQPSNPYAMELDSILRCFRNILKKLKVMGMSLQSGFPGLGRAGNPQIPLQHFLSYVPFPPHIMAPLQEERSCDLFLLGSDLSDIFSGVTSLLS